MAPLALKTNQRRLQFYKPQEKKDIKKARSRGKQYIKIIELQSTCMYTLSHKFVITHHS